MSKRIERCFNGAFHGRTEDMGNLIHVGKGIDALANFRALIDAMLCKEWVVHNYSLLRENGHHIMHGLAEISFHRLDLTRRKEVPEHAE